MFLYSILNGVCIVYTLNKTQLGLFLWLCLFCSNNFLKSSRRLSPSGKKPKFYVLCGCSSCFLLFTREEQVQIAVAIFEYFFCIPGNVANSLLKFLNTPDLRPFNAFFLFHNAGRYFLIYFRTILCYPFMSVAFYTYSVCLENSFFF